MPVELDRGTRTLAALSLWDQPRLRGPKRARHQRNGADTHNYQRVV